YSSALSVRQNLKVGVSRLPDGWSKRRLVPACPGSGRQTRVGPSPGGGLILPRPPSIQHKRKALKEPKARRQICVALLRTHKLQHYSSVVRLAEGKRN